MTKIVIDFEEEKFKEFKKRIKEAVLPDQPSDVIWEQGMDKGYLLDICEYLESGFDLKKQLSLINQFNHFQEIIDDLEIHFIHQLSEKKNVQKPLMLIHGWPGSFFEFYKVIGPLTNAGYSVVVPSLPGYGYSSIPKVTGCNTTKIAAIFNKLMKKLGYENYYAQGGDWGSFIARSLGHQFPINCSAIHVNMCFTPPPIYHVLEWPGIIAAKFVPKLFFSESEVAGMKGSEDYFLNGSGYFQIQSTKPQTLGYALTDSAIGLTAWISEKMLSWSGMRVSKDEILTNVLIYWFTKTITSSMRLYYEELKSGMLSVKYCSVPTGVTIFPEDILSTPQRWAKYHMNIQSWTNHNSGGHFASLEVPNDFVNEVDRFFKSL